MRDQLSTFSFAAAVEAANKLYFRGSAYPDSTDAPPQGCPHCLGSGLIFIRITANGQRVSEFCECPAGDNERKFIAR